MTFQLKSYLLPSLLVVSVVINVSLARRVQTSERQVAAAAVARSKVGTRIKELSGVDVSGSPVSFDLARTDRPTVIYVFRPDCGWCARNLKNLQALEASASSNGNFRLVGVSLDPAGLSPYMNSTGLTLPVYTNLPKGQISALGMGATPQTIVVSNGIVTHDWSGAYSGSLLSEISSNLGVTLPGLLPPKS